jgi:hypothetical protein
MDPLQMKHSYFQEKYVGLFCMSLQEKHKMDA